VIIAILNESKLQDVEVLEAIRAINRQITEDFERIWGYGGELRLLASGHDIDLDLIRSDAIIHLKEKTTALHTYTDTGLPTGHVWTNMIALADESQVWLQWTAALSHEALELIADPHLNTLVRGPHPLDRRREVFHFREICDPVQSNTYQIDGVWVSNFVLPHYYNSLGEPAGRNDFLGTVLKAFIWNPPNGYVGIWDPLADKRGAYVVLPDYKPHELTSKVLAFKGKAGRVARHTGTSAAKLAKKKSARTAARGRSR
jgi:hypothetical protein